MDQESIEKYAIDTSMERMELQNPSSLDNSNCTGTAERPRNRSDSVDCTNFPPSPPSEESFAFPFVACNAQIAQEQDLLNFKVQGNFRFFEKVEKILKGSLDSIPSPLPSVKVQIMGGKVCLRSKGKTLLCVVNKLLKTKSLLTSPSNVLPYYPMI